MDVCLPVTGKIPYSLIIKPPTSELEHTLILMYCSKLLKTHPRCCMQVSASRGRCLERASICTVKHLITLWCRGGHTVAVWDLDSHTDAAEPVLGRKMTFVLHQSNLLRTSTASTCLPSEYEYDSGSNRPRGRVKNDTGIVLSVRCRPGTPKIKMGF